MQAFRREPRNQEIFEHLDDRYRRANNWSGRLAGYTSCHPAEMPTTWNPLWSRSSGVKQP